MFWAYLEIETDKPAAFTSLAIILLSPSSSVLLKETDPGRLPWARAQAASGYTSQSIYCDNTILTRPWWCVETAAWMTFNVFHCHKRYTDFTNGLLQVTTAIDPSTTERVITVDRLCDESTIILNPENVISNSHCGLQRKKLTLEN